MIAWINNQKHRYVLWIGIILFFLGLYALVNRMPLDRYVIPFILGEEKIPFLPWTFVVYLSVFVQYFVVIYRIPHHLLGMLVSRFLWIIIISLIFFIVFPIEFPRHLYPGNWFIDLFRMTDGPGNCFPSLHVAETIFMAACYSFIEKRRLLQVGMWIWTLLIIVSVLTTKQHYLIDVIGGITLTAPFLFFLKRDLKNYSNDTRKL